MTRHLETIARQVPERAVQNLEQQFAGELIRPGDATYDHARQVWNAAVDRSPALIVRHVIRTA